MKISEQIRDIARPIWESFLTENSIKEDEIDMTLDDFCAEISLELT